MKECAVVGHLDHDRLVKPAAHVVLAAGFAATNALEQELQQFVQRYRGASLQPVELAPRMLFNPNLTQAWFGGVMEVINQITMLSIILTGAALIREREHGTVEHLLVMPLSAFEIMLAKVWSMGLVVLLAAALSLKLVVQGWLAVPIGGSIGLAAKRRVLAGRVLGVGRQQATLDVARSLGAIDEGTTDLLQAAGRSDVVVFCTPVDAIAGQVLAAAPLCRPGTLLTDAGSTKAAIVYGVETRIPDGVAFVGSHPLAGSEKRGPEHARADLFDGRPWILISGDADPDLLDRADRFVGALGATPVVVQDNGELHDRIVAAVSHLPQLVATTLLARVGESAGEAGLAWAGAGLRDTTRLAESGPAIWRSIVGTNREAIRPLLKAMAADLDALADRLDDPEAIDRLFARAHRWLRE